jgi:uncharacterized membrane protein
VWSSASASAASNTIRNVTTSFGPSDTRRLVEHRTGRWQRPNLCGTRVAVFERSLRAVLGFAIVIAAMTHALVSAAVPLSPQFFNANLAAPSSRNVVLLVVLGAFVLAGGFGTLLLARDRPTATSSLEWWVRVCCPLIALPFLLALFRHDFLTEIEAALMLSVVVIAFERLVRVSVTAWAERPSRASAVALGQPGVAARAQGALSRFFESPRLLLATVGLLAVGQAVFLGLWSVWSHQRFGTYGFDLGIYDNIFNSTLHGQWLAVPTMGMGEAWSDVRRNHADFAVFYLLPLYALKPGAITLLWLQSFFIAGGAVPLFLFARNRLSPQAALAVAVAWLLYPALQSSQMYDYHPQHVGAFWVLCAIASLEHRRWKLYWFFFALGLLVREDVSIGLTALGLYSVLSGYRVKTGLASIFAACTYFVAMRFGVMQSGEFSGMYKNLIVPGEASGFGSILVTLMTNPSYAAKTLLTMEKARYLSQILAPLAFLPMRRGWLWLLMIPGFFLTILSTEYLPTIQISFQYVANWAAYMFPATVIALAALGARGDPEHRQKAAIAALLAGSVIANYQWGAYSPRWSMRGGFVEVPLLRPTQTDVDREAALQGLLEKVPATARLCTGDRIQAHTTGVHVSNWPLRFGVGSCEWLLWSDLPGDLGSEHGAAALVQGTYTVVEQRNGVTLARKRDAL